MKITQNNMKARSIKKLLVELPVLWWPVNEWKSGAHFLAYVKMPIAYEVLPHCSNSVVHRFLMP